jgi:hypothetical protein
MVDGYPAYAWDAEYENQLLIDAEMAHAQQLHDAFERAFPIGPSATAAERIARLRHQPKADELYPMLFAAEDRREWLLPLVNRFEWNHAHGDPAAPWLARLTAMIRVALLTVRQVSEEEFLALAGPAEALVERHCSGYLERMARYTRQLERASALDGPMVDAVGTLLRLCERPEAAARIELFAWPYFRSETGLEGVPCWSTRVRRDLAQLEPKPRALWLRAFDAETHSMRAGAGTPTLGCHAAVERLGKVELEGGLRRWIGMLSDEHGPVLSPVGIMVFRHLIGLCDLLGGRACDDALLSIACAPWRRMEETEWLKTYMWSLTQRSNDHAVVCLESLMKNPATATEAVRQRYEAMTVSNTRVLAAAALGVIQPVETRKIAGEDGSASSGFASVDKSPLALLLGAIREGGGNLKVFNLCRSYVAEHGWSVELVAAMPAWIAALGNAASDNHYRALVEWFVWFEDVAPVDPDACWSHRVKQDLRSMEGAELGHWLTLLDNSTFIITAKPPKRWMRVAEPAFERVGAEAFRLRFVKWFEPFTKGEAVRLTVTGRNILRLLMWYALIAKDLAVDEALAGFAGAKWKNQESAKLVPQAEMAFSYVLSERSPERALPVLEQLVSIGQAFEGSRTHRIYEELCARANRKPVPAIPKPPAPASKEDGMSTMLDALLTRRGDGRQGAL